MVLNTNIQTYKSQHACLKHCLLKVQHKIRVQLPHWFIVGFQIIPPHIHKIDKCVMSSSKKCVPCVNQRVKRSYACLKVLIADHIYHGFDTAFQTDTEIEYVRYSSSFLIAGFITTPIHYELHRNLSQYCHLWTHHLIYDSKYFAKRRGLQQKQKAVCRDTQLSKCADVGMSLKAGEYTQLFLFSQTQSVLTIPFLGYLLKISTHKHSNGIPTIVCLINMNQVIDSLSDMGFCDRLGNPKPNFRYYQDSQYSAVARVSAILRGLASYYDLAEVPHDKRRCMTRWSYILTHSLAMVFAAKFKLGTRARVFARAGRNLQKPCASQSVFRRKPGTRS